MGSSNHPAAQESLGRLHQRLGEGRMRVDGGGEILRGDGRLHGQRRLRDQLTRPWFHDADAHHAAGGRIDHELGEPVGAAEGSRAFRGRPRELDDAHVASLLLGGVLGETALRHLGVGEDDTSKGASINLEARLTTTPTALYDIVAPVIGERPVARAAPYFTDAAGAQVATPGKNSVTPV